MFEKLLHNPTLSEGNLTLRLRALNDVESHVLSNRYAKAFKSLYGLSETLDDNDDPVRQATDLVCFTLEHSKLVVDVIAYGSDQHQNREAISDLSPETKLLAFGQVLMLTGLRMQTDQVLNSPSSNNGKVS